MTDAIEAGARVPDSVTKIIDTVAKGIEDRLGYDIKTHRDFARVCIEAAIASGALVPASAVAEMRERCAADLSEFTELVRSGDFYSDYDASMELLGKADDALKTIRQLDIAPACGDYVQARHQSDRRHERPRRSRSAAPHCR